MMSAMKSRMSVTVTLVGVGSVSSDGSPDEKESEELRLQQRQQVNDSSPLLALANGGTNADIVSSTTQGICEPQPSTAVQKY